MKHGLLAEFDSPSACTQAIRTLKSRGIRQLDAYMPYAAKEVQEALEVKPSPLPRIVFVAGCIGATVAYLILWYTNVYDYPLNVGGRSTHAVPAFIPITFETTVLVAGCTAFIGALVLGGLPRLYHPVDETEDFELVSVNRFLLAVNAADDGFDKDALRTMLSELGALSVRELGALGSARPSSQAEPQPEHRG